MMNQCRRCDTRGGACQDCVVAALELLNEARHLEADELRALGVLVDAGLVSPLRLSTMSVTVESISAVSGGAESGRAESGRMKSGRPGPRSRPAPRVWAIPATKAS